MDKTLMDKEVICILDTRQIQRYMFHTNSFIDTLGGSDLMTHILRDAIVFALTHIDPPLSGDEYDVSTDADVSGIPYFMSDRIRFQLIICAAGNALCMVRTGALCQKIIRKISRYFLDTGYSLNLAAAAVEKHDNMGNDIFYLYQKLNRIKAASEISNPAEVLPVIIHEKRTGDPVIGFDPGTRDYISMSSRVRRMEAKKRGRVIGISELRRTKASDGKDYLAVIHADGNNLGITIGSILQTTPDYQEGILIRRRINRNITAIYDSVMKRTVKELKDFYISGGGKEEDFLYSFQIIHQAGDDVNIICSAALAFPFLRFFYRNLDGSLLWDDGERKIPLYVCAGVSFVTAGSTFHEAFSLAEECCQNAKTVAKKERNLRNGLAGNRMDFQVCDTPNVQRLELLRERSYTTASGIDLLLRPYCPDVEEKDSPFYFETLFGRVAALRSMGLDQRQKTMLKEVYHLSRSEYVQWIREQKQHGHDFVRFMGSPLYTDDEKKTHAVWFDAVEIADFIPAKQ